MVLNVIKARLDLPIESGIVVIAILFAPADAN